MTLIDRLEQTRGETLRYFELEPIWLDQSYAPGKWTIRQLLHHLCDAETVLFDRIRRVISEPRQVIWAFDQDAWASGLDYESRPLSLSRDLFAATRAGVIHYAGLHYESNGHKEFVHSEAGVRTLKQEFDKVAAHNRGHLDQIAAASGDGHPSAP
jgi:DinB superfamily